MSTSSYLQLFSNQQAEVAPMFDGNAQGPQVGAGAGSPTYMILGRTTPMLGLVA